MWKLLLLIILIIIVAFVIYYTKIDIFTEHRGASEDKTYYIGYWKKDVVYFVPTPKSSGKKAVQATDLMCFALLDMIPNVTEHIDVSEKSGKMIIKEKYPGAFNALHVPGYLYEVSSREFHLWRKYYYWSNKKVYPIKEIHIPDIFDALKKEKSRVKLITFSHDYLYIAHPTLVTYFMALPYGNKKYVSATPLKWFALFSIIPDALDKFTIRTIDNELTIAEKQKDTFKSLHTSAYLYYIPPDGFHKSENDWIFLKEVAKIDPEKIQHIPDILAEFKKEKIKLMPFTKWSAFREKNNITE